MLKKPNTHLQTILKTPVNFQKDRTKTVREVKGTKYLLKIRNHAPRKTKNSVPPLFFEKAGDKKQNLFIYASVAYAFPTRKDLTIYINNKLAFLFRKMPTKISRDITATIMCNMEKRKLKGSMFLKETFSFKKTKGLTRTVFSEENVCPPPV